MKITKSSHRGTRSPNRKPSNGDMMMDVECADNNLNCSIEDTDESERVETSVVCALDFIKAGASAMYGFLSFTLDLFISIDEFNYFKVDGNCDVCLGGSRVVGPRDTNGGHGGNCDLSRDEYELCEENASGEINDLEDPSRVQEGDGENPGGASRAAVPTDGTRKKDGITEKENFGREADRESPRRPLKHEQCRIINKIIDGASFREEGFYEASKRLGANDGRVDEQAEFSAVGDLGNVWLPGELEQGPTGSPVTAKREEMKPGGQKVI
ncbi:unnamed protein product [Tuber aestivum]|uniref:Uncharacterized protein n=1 Tax=Tuber aestivum TaxID=59557 RepID=A0A292Q2V9_9PEZI|nr:unnamed protein product [Tuber aestivum]